MLKVVCISDTHNRHKHLTSLAAFPNRLPDGDLLIHAGDSTGIGLKGEVESVAEWMLKQAKRYTYGIVFIAGNHDRSFDPKYRHKYESTEETGNKPGWLLDILSDFKSSGNVHYLENSSVEVNGFNIWGSPVTPWFHGDSWAFNQHRGPDIEEYWNRIPLDTDILVTHGPPAYIGDYIPGQNSYVGCENLRTRVKIVKPLMHIFGHIHEGYGLDGDSDTVYVNASICNTLYEPRNKPWRFLIDKPSRTIAVTE